jgi:transcription termination factor Rho
VNRSLKPVEGYLEILDRGFGFLRSIEKNFQPDPMDTFVPMPLVKKLNLPEGAYIEGGGVPGNGKNRNLKLAEVETINGIAFEDFAEIESLHDKTSIDPLERFILTKNEDDITGKALDLVVPMGRGQRGLIISPPKSGKTTLLKHIASAIIANHPDVAAFILLVDERPEEVTDFKRGLKEARVLFSSADQSVSQHMRITRITMNTAIRYAETGRDAVVLIDSLTRMSRAFNAETRSHGRTLSGGLAANALEVPRRIFGAARNIENGGSLTVIATILVETGSRMDDIIYQEFKGTGNMDLVLSRKCAEQRLWPAIDINQSGTRKEHLLLDKPALEEVMAFRRKLAGKDEVTALSEFLEFL